MSFIPALSLRASLTIFANHRQMQNLKTNKKIKKKSDSGKVCERLENS
jgi:hypothetical protein